MGLKRTYEFCNDAVRIALTSGLTRDRVQVNVGKVKETLEAE